MDRSSPREVALQDPLGELTRKERRSLLIASVLGVVLVEGGFVPTKIATFGIEFTNADQRSLLTVVGIVVLYQLSGFLIYAASDFIKWRIAHINSLRAGVVEQENRVRKPQPKLEEILKEEEDPWDEFDRDLEQTLRDNWTRAVDRNMLVLSLSTPVSIARVVFEFVLPVAIGVYAIYVLWTGGGLLPSS